MILLIDTSQFDRFTIALADGQGDLSFVRHVAGLQKQSEKLLPEIDKLLKLKKIRPDSLKGIGVMRGPGGFTSLRIGVITANSLAYVWCVPIVGVKNIKTNDIRDFARQIAINIRQKKFKTLVSPFYGQEPNITKAKRQ